jgi:hypothetical protein
VVGFEFLSVEEFVYFMDSMDGGVSFPVRIEADAFLEPNEYEAAVSRADFKVWFESYRLSHMEQDRVAWRSE